MNKNNRIVTIIVCLIVLVLSMILCRTRGKVEMSLPKPELSEGLRGQYGIDKNINETTIDNYLNRTDTVYRDVRMLVDPATWENKGGDRYLSGYIKGFEIIPSPYLANYTDDYIEQKKKENISGLYQGKTLFKLDNDGNYTPNYVESMDILETIFPQDKNIFIICGAGGYAGQVKRMLIKLGWDEDKVRDIGGYWYYEGKNSIQVKETKDGKDYYNFSKVPYYNIDFDSLTEI
jgi:rhodanese-related sulfurtransferase